jgi:hypothetical protein
MSNTAKKYSLATEPCGKPWHEWVHHWWRWCYSSENDGSPVSDKSGKCCSQNQIYDKVWFLAGTFGGRAERYCKIPQGRSILFPILNDIISFATDPHLKTEEDLRSYAKADLDETKYLYAEVDGYQLQDVHEYRILTPPFDITVPTGDRNKEHVRTKAVSDGYWLFLEPLLPGTHRIEFAGEKLDYDNIQLMKTKSDPPVFRVEVIYRIVVD